MRYFFSAFLVLAAAASRSEIRDAYPMYAPQDTANSFLVTTSRGQKFIGTWTVIAAASDTVRGTWTLVDSEARTLAFGDWSAVKSRGIWNGAWRATVERREGSYGGTWSSDITLEGSAEFPSLFEQALRAVVGGKWRMGQHSGNWSIRAYHR